MHLEEQLKSIQATATEDPDAAIFKLRDLLQGNDDVMSGWYIKGCIAFLQQDFQAGAEAFRKIVEADPKHEEASRYLFHCYWQQRDQVKALEEIKRFWQTFGANHDSPIAGEFRRIVGEIRQGQ